MRVWMPATNPSYPLSDRDRDVKDERDRDDRDRRENGANGDDRKGMPDKLSAATPAILTAMKQLSIAPTALPTTTSTLQSSCLPIRSVGRIP